MTTYKQGDIVLIEFKYADGTGAKKRPALVVSNHSYNSKRNELVLLGITSNIKRKLPGDTLIDDWQKAGLLKSSIVTAIVNTLSKKLVLKKIGVLGKKELDACIKHLDSVLCVS